MKKTDTGQKKNHFLHPSCHTDLAVEMKEDIEQFQKLQGVEVTAKKHKYHQIVETKIKIVDERGVAAFGKPVGSYVTLEIERIDKKNVQDKIASIIGEVIENMAPHSEHILVAGLGNKNVTPDSLGPMVMDRLMVTRHLFAEKVFNSDNLSMKVVSAIAPGVMGQTGMESLEVLKGIIGEIHPDTVIVIDALAARSSNRLNKTIQICDTGISPGAGVGNNRKEINEENLGVRVIAIGVPTVIAVPTIICDAMENMLFQLGADRTGKLVEKLNSEEQYQLAQELVQPYFTDMFVTPKNIDEELERISSCIADGINDYVYR